MAIDRKRVEELKGQTPPAERTVRGAGDLFRACRACRTAGELVAMSPRVERFERRRLEKIDARAHRLMGRIADVGLTREDIAEMEDAPPAVLDSPADRVNQAEALVVARLRWAIANAREMSPDAPLDDRAWGRLSRQRQP